MQTGHPISLRVFGSEPGDLELDFEAGASPEVTTQVIATCAGIEQGHVWRLTVGERLRLLLAIVAQGTAGEWTIEQHCPHCEMASEVDLNASAVLDRQPAPALTLRVEAEGVEIWLRLPTGEDQLAWLRQTVPDVSEAALIALRSLVTDASGSALSRESLEQLLEPAEAALDSADPLVDFRILSVCPGCGKELACAVDWTEFAFGRLRQGQRDLIETVHRLASRYHWSEAEIFSVPAWRRRFYLAALAKEGN